MTFIISQQAHIFASQTAKQKHPSPALLSYRATPIQTTGYSPAQLMLGLQIRTPIPTLEEKLLPQWPDITLVKAADARAKAAYKHYYDRCHSSCPLPLLKPCEKDSVADKLDNQKGWMTKCNTPRSYFILTNDGILCRNRRHLRLLTLPLPHPELEDGEETDIINTAETDSG